MSNTFSQIYIHAIFAVKYRRRMIHKYWRDELYPYIAGIINKNGCKSIAVNGYDDHIHIFFGFDPQINLSDLIRDVKRSSSHWINQNKKSSYNFAWQRGYGAFSYSHSQIGAVIKYIENQELHHSKKSFLEEYESFLQKFAVEYNQKFIFIKPI